VKDSCVPVINGCQGKTGKNNDIVNYRLYEHHTLAQE